MPHLTIEHSSNLSDEHDVSALVDAVHLAALTLDFLPVAGLRTRAAARPDFRVASGDPSYGFIAAVARIGPGRTADQKADLIVLVLDTIESTLGIDGASADPQTSGGLRLALSCEVQEIDADARENRNHVRPHFDDTNSTDSRPGGAT